MKLKFLWRFIKNNIRYIIILLILLSVPSYGYYYEKGPDEELKKEYSLIKKGIYLLKSSQDSIIFNDVLQTIDGSYYRISFDSTVLPSSENNAFDALNNVSRNNEGVVISAIDQLGLERKLGVVSLLSDGHLRTYDLLFFSDGNYKDVVVKKSNVDYDGLISISNIESQLVYCNSPNCDNDTVSSLNGNNISIIKSENSALSYNSSQKVKYSSNNQTIGRLVNASKDEDIVSVDLAVRKLGDGGLGGYQINLYKIDGEGEYKIESPYFSTYSFSADDLYKYNMGNNIYRIPFSAKLTPGKYFIGISNYGVKRNVLNSLQYYLTKDSEDAKEIRSQKIKSKMNIVNTNLYLILNKTERNEDSNNAYNSKIQDLGNGRGLYSYKLSNSSFDLLDIWSYKMEGGVFNRDSSNPGYFILKANKAEIVYKFDTMYNFGRFYLRKIDLTNEFSISEVYYSFDNNSYSQIRSNDDTTIYDQLVDGGYDHDKLYLKIVFKKAFADSTDKVKFGVNDIQAYADLKL